MPGRRIRHRTAAESTPKTAFVAEGKGFEPSVSLRTTRPLGAEKTAIAAAYAVVNDACNDCHKQFRKDE
jgi:cytochrome c556